MEGRFLELKTHWIGFGFPPDRLKHSWTYQFPEGMEDVFLKLKSVQDINNLMRELSSQEKERLRREEEALKKTISFCRDLLHYSGKMKLKGTHGWYGDYNDFKEPCYIRDYVWTETTNSEIEDSVAFRNVVFQGDGFQYRILGFRYYPSECKNTWGKSITHYAIVIELILV